MTVLRVLIEPQFLRDGVWYVAQCLEYDLAVQARSAQEAEDEFVQLVRSRCAVAADRQIEDPFHGIRPAPKRFEALWENALRVESRPQISFGTAQSQPCQVESRVA